MSAPFVIPAPARRRMAPCLCAHVSVQVRRRATSLADLIHHARVCRAVTGIEVCGTAIAVLLRDGTLTCLDATSGEQRSRVSLPVGGLTFCQSLHNAATVLVEGDSTVVVNVLTQQVSAKLSGHKVRPAPCPTILTMSARMKAAGMTSDACKREC